MRKSLSIRVHEQVLRVYARDGSFIETEAPYGVELAFTESKELRWTPEEDGCLTIRPLPEDTLTLNKFEKE